MKSKEYLSQIIKLEHKIERMKVRCKEYEHLADSASSPVYDKDKIDGTKPKDAPFLKWLFKKDELEHDIMHLEEELKNLKVDALIKIEQIENEDYKTILIKKYFESKTWEDIRKEMFVSKATIYRWYDEALVSLSAYLKDETL